MLERFFTTPLSLGLAQAALVTVSALAVMVLARRQSIHLERETLVALARGFVQIILVGLVLLPLLHAPLWVGVAVLGAMLPIAAAICAQRAEGIPGAFRVSLIGIATGAGAVILPMTLAGVITPEIGSMVPVGSMIIANAMNSCAQALERFRAEVTAHTGQIEAGLALGAEPEQLVARYVQSAVTASLIPRIDSLASLGIVWIPGLMAGMLLSGSDPVYAAIYQFVVIGMIYASSGLASVVTALRVRRQAFSAADQLVLRPKAPTRSGRARGA